MASSAEAHFSPLARIGIGAALLGGAALLFSIRGCGEGERPTIGQREAVTTTTTIPEKKAEWLWFEKFGWDHDYTDDVAQDLLNNIANGDTVPTNIAAGRCIVTLYDGGGIKFLLRHEESNNSIF